MMGGRGAYSPSFPMIPSGKPGGKWDTEHPAMREPTTLKEALGIKGTPMSISNATSGANPYFGADNDYLNYKTNCQRCVIAYELRRRGYDVVALPSWENDHLGKAAPHLNANGTINRYWMGAFKGAKSESVAAKRNSTVRKNIEVKMKEYGNGSRAIISIKWQGRNSGHVFNVENVNGKIVYSDAQTGERVNIKEYLSRTEPGRTQITRTDNLRISERAKKSVMQKRG